MKNADEVNPPQVNYTWFPCDNDNCDESSAKWKNKSQSLRLNSQPTPDMKYGCIAKNAAGSDFKTTHVIGQESKCKFRVTGC